MQRQKPGRYALERTGWIKAVKGGGWNWRKGKTPILFQKKRGTVPLRCRGTVLFFMRGIVPDQKRKSTTTEEQKRIILPKAPATTALLRSEGVSGGATSPGCGSVAQFQSLFRQKRRKRAQNCDTLTPESHVNANTPTETIPRERARGCRGRREPPAKKSQKAKQTGAKSARHLAPPA